MMDYELSNADNLELVEIEEAHFYIWLPTNL
jgi:hypothetical protein